MTKNCGLALEVVGTLPRTLLARLVEGTLFDDATVVVGNLDLVMG
jgi:hypothetical protein